VVVVLEDDFQQIVAGARLEGFDLGRGREKGCGDHLAYLRVHPCVHPIASKDIIHKTRLTVLDGGRAIY
jgi:hypothetical protein